MIRNPIVRRVALPLTVVLLAAATPVPAPRFDNQVRDLFFSGFAGVTGDLDAGMALCEEALARNPDHPEALVWHGAGTFFRGGMAYREGDRVRGHDLQERGQAEMARAAALKPNHPATLVPRAAMLMGAAQQVSNPAVAEPWLRTAVADYETVVTFHAAAWSTLSVHSAGELLAALAEGWDRLGDAPKSRVYLERIVAELPGTRYAARAQARLAAGQRTERLTCLGCHKSAAN
jgi:hypothetical protein